MISGVTNEGKAGKEAVKDLALSYGTNSPANAPVKTYEQILRDVKDYYAKNNLKPIKIKFPKGDVNVYGERCEAQLIEKAMKKLPKSFTEKIDNFKDIYVDDFLLKYGNEVRNAGGMCDGENIVLNRSFLSPGHNLKNNKLLYEMDFLMRENTRWVDTFNHELFHAVDRTLGKANGGRYLSEMIKEFSEPGASNISRYASEAKLSYETAAETFMSLMKEKRKFEQKNKFFDEKVFIDEISEGKYGNQFKVIIKNYLLDAKSQILW